MTLESLSTEINRLNSVKSCIDKLSSLSAKTVHETILVKYIQLQNAADVASEINEMGCRIQTDKGLARKYISNDITSMFNKPYDISFGNREIFILAKSIYHFYKGKVNWNHIVRICEEIDI
jgi:hypothetical protein